MYFKMSFLVILSLFVHNISDSCYFKDIHPDAINELISKFRALFMHFSGGNQNRLPLVVIPGSHIVEATFLILTPLQIPFTVECDSEFCEAYKQDDSEVYFKCVNLSLKVNTYLESNVS